MTISITTRIEAVQAVLNGSTLTKAAQDYGMSVTTLRKCINDTEILFEAYRLMELRKRVAAKRSTRTTPLIAIIYDLLQYARPMQSQATARTTATAHKRVTSGALDDLTLSHPKSIHHSHFLSAAEIYQILLQNEFFGHQPICKRTVSRIILDIKEQLTDPKNVNENLDRLIMQHQFNCHNNP